MKIQIGEITMEEINMVKPIYPLPNKSAKYLVPILKGYGAEFIKRFNSVYKVAVGIGDIVVENVGYNHQKHLFILIDTKAANTTPFFQNFLLWIRAQEHIYQDDYVFGDIQKTTKHMVVIKFPEQYYKAFETFKIGKYSKMFDKDAIDKFFEEHPTTKRIFIKDHEYRYYFVGRLNRLYGTSISGDEYDGELDLPPTEKTEIFNHYLKRKDGK